MLHVSTTDSKNREAAAAGCKSMALEKRNGSLKNMAPPNLGGEKLANLHNSCKYWAPSALQPWSWPKARLQTCPASPVSETFFHFLSVSSYQSISSNPIASNSSIHLPLVPTYLSIPIPTMPTKIEDQPEKQCKKKTPLSQPRLWLVVRFMFYYPNKPLWMGFLP